MTVFLSTSLPARAQDTVLNKYKLWVIGNSAAFQKTVKNNSDKQMLDVKKHVPGIVLDLKYAGTKNFMQQQLYTGATSTYLRKPAIDALVKVQNGLKEHGMGLKVFDAYRPYSITEKMWEPIKDDRYAADPKKGSGHNRGIAIDLTLINLKTKKELDMGTGFDNFSDTAHHDFLQLPGKVKANRLLLKTLMEKYGFKALDSEWWHYALPDSKSYELLDLSFPLLKNLN